VSDEKNRNAFMTNLIQCNNTKKTLKIPLIYRNKIIKHKYNTYKFNGKYFEVVKTSKINKGNRTRVIADF